MATAEPAPAPPQAEAPAEPARADPWWAALMLPGPLAVGWAVAAHAAGVRGFFATVASGLLLLMFAVAAYTDLRGRYIYNWTTYTAVLAVIALHAVSALVPDGALIGLGGRAVAVADLIGCPPARATVFGFLLGFGVLFALFVVGATGGGDLKLVVAAGCFVGPLRLIEGLINTYILAGVAVAVFLVWRVGPRVMLAVGVNRVLAPFGFEINSRGAADLKPLMQLGLPMAPFYAAGILVAVALRS